jgi:hypothetical protein
VHLATDLVHQVVEARGAIGVAGIGGVSLLLEVLVALWDCSIPVWHGEQFLRCAGTQRSTYLFAQLVQPGKTLHFLQ